MVDSASIRIAKNQETVFREILTSLEIDRPAKSEEDILGKIREHFHLPVSRKNWPERLSRSCSVEEFLDFVLEQLTPFVQMILELYGFFAKTVSTTGGRTTHFEIRGGLKHALKFPDVAFPRKVQWIQSWAEIQVEHVTIDWEKIGRALIIDNGIFYGRVQQTRILQSLIIARRNERLSPKLRALGDRIGAIMRRAVNAWHARQRAERLARGIANPARWVERVFVPNLNHYLAQEGLINTRDSEVGVDLEKVLSPDLQGLNLSEVFCDPALKDVSADGGEENKRRDWNLQAALFFLALWQLDEPSFQTVSLLLTAHESRPDLLFDWELDAVGPQLATELIQNLEAAIASTGETTTVIERVRKKLEILLLPYWKDRWFLYEVWTLCLPMLEVQSLNGRVDLLGIRTIANPGIEGTTWDLPTQKARAPVAVLRGSTNGESLLVWFQRETRSRNERRNIEPDVRITMDWLPYDDLMILECKDRIKFRRSNAQKVARTYLNGTTAEIVWVVNYEASTQAKTPGVRMETSGRRQIGVAYSVRPNSGDGAVRSSIKTFLGAKLNLGPRATAQPDTSEYYLAIDVSGSTTGKPLPALPMFRQTPRTPIRAYLWCESVAQVNLRELEVGKPSPRLSPEKIENGAALARFVLSLPPKAKVIVVTDEAGKATVKRYLTHSDGKYAFHPGDFGEHRVQFVLV